MNKNPLALQRHKIALIGCGQVGGTIAHLLSQKELGDVVMLDTRDEIAQGKSLDLKQSCSLSGSHSVLTGGTDYSLIKGADVIIVTAGFTTMPGMRRDDLLSMNTHIIASIGKKIKKHAPQAFVIVITNPLDAMTWVMQQSSNLPHHKIVGMAGILDSSRYRTFLSERLQVSVRDIQAFVLGGHGDSMVLLPRYTTVAGIPLAEIIEMGWISQKEVDDIIARTKKGGSEIVDLLKTGSAYYAPAESAIQIVESYLKDHRRILPCSVNLNGEYGLSNIFIGVPAIIGAKGVEKIVPLSLNEEEKVQLSHSARGVQQLMTDIKKLKLLKL